MKKSELIAEVAKKTGLSKKDVTKVIDSTISTIEENLKKGEKISFLGFGNFEIVTRKAREANVPGTNKKVKVPESKTVKFKVSKKLKSYLNEK